jgi:hypothetical protein
MPYLAKPYSGAPSVASAPEPTPAPTSAVSSPEPSPTSGLRGLEIAIVALLILIAGLLVVTIFLLFRKKR